MNAYLDTGVFIDYLSSRGPMGTYLRTTDRNGRSPATLATDAERCLQVLSKNHCPMTSSMTFYEVEEAFYKELARSISGVSHAARYLIPTARSVVSQLFIASELHKVVILDVSDETVRRQIESIDLNVIRAADALHVSLAISNDADIIISGDGGILDLDCKFQNSRNANIRCLDSDRALALL